MPDARKASALVDRNPFCSACSSTGDPVSSPDADGIVATAQPLLLVATTLGSAPFASIRSLETGAQGAFRIGDIVPGGSTIEKIAGTFVWLRTAGATGRIERLDLLATVATKPAASAAASPVASANAPDWAARVRKIDDANYEVDRELVRELVGGGATARIPGVRIAPATSSDGKLRGVRVARAGKDSLATGLGLRTGDVIEALDGHAIDSPDVLLEAYGRLASSSSVHIKLTRGGKPVELDYQLR